MNKEAEIFRQMVETTKIFLDRGVISYEEAQKTLQPYIDKANARGRVVAKKHGKRYKPLTFMYLMR